MAGMEEGLFPHSQSMGTDEDLEEERRLCYVGITRAKRKLFVTWTPFRKNYGPDAGFPANVSRFLEEMPQDLLDGLDSYIQESFDQRPQFENRFFGQSRKSDRANEKRNRIHEEPFIQPKSIAELKAYLDNKQKQMGTGDEKTGTAVIFKSGMRVRHDQFGEGIVLSRQRMGKEIKLVVTFSRVGKKSLIEKYAKLKPL
jgi:DNA helicase-2/ATP-dependent DNA helicase PcrA